MFTSAIDVDFIVAAILVHSNVAAIEKARTHSCHLQLVGERFDEVHHCAGADTVTRDSERGRSCERSGPAIWTYHSSKGTRRA